MSILARFDLTNNSRSSSIRNWLNVIPYGSAICVKSRLFSSVIDADKEPIEWVTLGLMIEVKRPLICIRLFEINLWLGVMANWSTIIDCGLYRDPQNFTATQQWLMFG
jgi:hypothetical protein